MTYSRAGLQLTESFEGCRLSAYPDSKGIPTIGYGHTDGVYLGMTCTQDQAEQWLDEDITWAANCVSFHVIVTLTQGEFDALVDFVFNCGATAFIHSTMLELLNAGDMEDAAKAFEVWDRAGGVVVAGLLRRRLAEEKEFEQQ